MKSWNGEICQPTNEAHLLLIASLFIEQKLFVCVEITHLAPSAITLSYQFLSPLLFRLSEHLDSSFWHSQNQSSALPVLIAGKREVGPQKTWWFLWPKNHHGFCVGGFDIALILCKWTINILDVHSNKYKHIYFKNKVHTEVWRWRIVRPRDKSESQGGFCQRFCETPSFILELPYFQKLPLAIVHPGFTKHWANNIHKSPDILPSFLCSVSLLCWYISGKAAISSGL